MVEGRTWQFQDARARLSELVRLVRRGEADTITVHGEEAVVVLDSATYGRGPAHRVSGEELLRVLRASPLRQMDLSDDKLDLMFARDASDVGRDIDLTEN